MAELSEQELSAGTIVVKLDNHAANLIPLLLEPQSSYGLVAKRSADKYYFSDFLQERNIYPMRRVVPYS